MCAEHATDDVSTMAAEQMLLALDHQHSASWQMTVDSFSLQSNQYQIIVKAVPAWFCCSQGVHGLMSSLGQYGVSHS